MKITVQLHIAILLLLILASDGVGEENSDHDLKIQVEKEKLWNKHHYEGKEGLVGYPEFSIKPEERSKQVSTQEILHSMRMTSDMDWPKTKEEAESKAKNLKEHGFNVVRWGERYFLADDPQEELPSLLRGETLENKIKYAKIYIPALHRHGIKFLWQPTLPLVTKAYIQRNPSMATIDLRTGEIFEDAGYGTAMACPFNDTLLEDLIRRMEKVIREAGGDGIMFDDHQMFRIDHCGCIACQEKYKKRTGKELLKTIPPLLKNGDRNHPDMVEWFKWRSDEVIATYVKARERVKKINPDLFICTYNNSNTVAGAYLAAGVSAEAQSDYADTIGMETQYPGNAYKYYWPLLIVESKFTRAVTEKAKAGFWGLIYNQDPTDLMIGAFISLAQGFDQWWILYDKPLERAAQPLVYWKEKYEKILAKPISMANVGVPFSSGSMHHAQNVKPRRWEHGYVSTCNALTNRQIPYSIILDEDFGNVSFLIKNFKTILMFDQYNVSDRQIKAVREFVLQGGNLIASGETSLYDENGKKRPNFGLSDLFGCSYQGDKSTRSNLMIPTKNAVTSDVVGEFKHRESFVLVNQVKEGVQRVGSMKTLDGKEYEGILAQKVGKGNVVYLTGNPALSAFYSHYNENRIERGKLWTDDRIPGYDRLISQLASYENKEMPMILHNGTTEIVAEVYSHQNAGMKGVQIRLVNMIGSRIKTGEVPADNTIDFPAIESYLPDPKKPLSLTVRAPGTKKAYMISPDFEETVELPFRVEKEEVKLEVPKLYRCALIYLSSGDDREILKMGKVVKETPSAKALIYSKSTPLLKRINEKEITFFPEMEKVKGGIARSFYKNEMSTFIYGTESDHNEINVEFDSEVIFKQPVLEIGGMNDNGKAYPTIEITLNEERLFLGKARFPSDEWGVSYFSLRNIKLNEKNNQLKIRIVGKGTRAGPPWFGVTYLRFREVTPEIAKKISIN